MKRAQRRVDIKKDMDELHKAISKRDLDIEKIKTEVFDSGATSNCGMVGDDFILTE